MAPCCYHYCCSWHFYSVFVGCSKAGPLRALFRDYASNSVDALTSATHTKSTTISDPYARRANDAAGSKEQYYYSDYYAAWAPPTLSTPGGAASRGAHRHREQEQQMRQVRAQAAEWCSKDRLVELFIDFHVLVPSSVPSLHNRKSACKLVFLSNACGCWSLTLPMCGCCFLRLILLGLRRCSPSISRSRLVVTAESSRRLPPAQRRKVGGGGILFYDTLTTMISDVSVHTPCWSQLNDIYAFAALRPWPEFSNI